MFVTKGMAFGEIPTARISMRESLYSATKKVSRNIEFNVIETLSELSELTDTFQKREKLRRLKDTEIIALNNAIYTQIAQKNTITLPERELLNVISRAIEEKGIRFQIEETLKMSHEDGISRYNENIGRIEILNGWTKISKYTILP